MLLNCAFLLVQFMIIFRWFSRGWLSTSPFTVTPALRIWVKNMRRPHKLPLRQDTLLVNKHHPLFPPFSPRRASQRDKKSF